VAENGQSLPNIPQIEKITEVTVSLFADGTINVSFPQPKQAVWLTNPFFLAGLLQAGIAAMFSSETVKKKSPLEI
jgi:hypothetical protein